MSKIDLKLVCEEFTPSMGEVFFYKPSKTLNYIVWADKKYVDYLVRVYGEIPMRINPVKLNLMKEDKIVFGDIIFDEVSTGILEDMLNNGGNCQVIVREGKYYLGGMSFESKTPLFV